MSSKLVVSLLGIDGKIAKNINIELKDLPPDIGIITEPVVVDFMEVDKENPIIMVRGVQVTGVNE